MSLIYFIVEFKNSWFLVLKDDNGYPESRPEYWITGYNFAICSFGLSARASVIAATTGFTILNENDR